jgi:hypothetical protein
MTDTAWSTSGTHGDRPGDDAPCNALQGAADESWGYCADHLAFLKRPDRQSGGERNVVQTSVVAILTLWTALSCTGPQLHGTAYSRTYGGLSADQELVSGNRVEAEHPGIRHTPARGVSIEGSPQPVHADDLLDWDLWIDPPVTEAPSLLSVRIVHSVEGRPLPVEDPWA